MARAQRPDKEADTRERCCSLLVRGAVNATDYGLPVARIVIPQGQLSGSVALDIRQDTLDEDDEVLILEMGLTLNASHGAVSRQTIHILDDDAKPSVFLTSKSRSFDESVPSILVTASLSVASGRDVVVPLIFSGTATAGQDYEVPVNPTITIPAGSLTGSYVINLIDDTAVEPAETIVVGLATSGQAVLSTLLGQATANSFIIAANDAPVISLDSANLLTAEGAQSIQIRARLSRFTDERILVPFTVSGTATNGVDYQIVSSQMDTVGSARCART